VEPSDAPPSLGLGARWQAESRSSLRDEGAALALVEAMFNSRAGVRKPLSSPRATCATETALALHGQRACGKPASLRPGERLTPALA
jgi:hypothetical protein